VCDLQDFRFSAENELSFSFSFIFRPKVTLAFTVHFRLRPKMNNAVLAPTPMNVIS
jgi:hypothetical protein